MAKKKASKKRQGVLPPLARLSVEHARRKHNHRRPEFNDGVALHSGTLAHGGNIASYRQG